MSVERKSKPNRLLKLHKELMASEGLKIVIRLSTFDNSLKIFLSNYADLEASIIKHVEVNKLIDFYNMQQRKAVQDELFEVLRHLHNTVAAALSLVDHTRVFYKEFYDKNSMIPNYQAEIDKRFAKDGLSHFVKCLRQFCQHYKTPLVSSVLDIDNKHGRHVRRIMLRKDDMAEFDAWTAPAKAYMKTLPENIHLLDVVRAYHDHVVGFYEWFKLRLGHIHRADLEHYRHLVTEIEQNRGLPSMPPWAIS